MYMEETKSKFSIIPTFADYEIQVEDYVFVKNKFDNVNYINFIDINGQIGKMKEENVGILIINEPTQEDLDDFARLKRESIEFTEKFKNKKIENNPNYC